MRRPSTALLQLRLAYWLALAMNSALQHSADDSTRSAAPATRRNRPHSHPAHGRAAPSGGGVSRRRARRGRHGFLFPGAAPAAAFVARATFNPCAGDAGLLASFLPPYSPYTEQLRGTRDAPLQYVHLRPILTNVTESKASRRHATRCASDYKYTRLPPCRSTQDHLGSEHDYEGLAKAQKSLPEPRTDQHLERVREYAPRRRQQTQLTSPRLNWPATKRTPRPPGKKESVPPPPRRDTPPPQGPLAAAADGSCGRFPVESRLQPSQSSAESAAQNSCRAAVPSEAE